LRIAYYTHIRVNTSLLLPIYHPLWQSRWHAATADGLLLRLCGDRNFAFNWRALPCGIPSGHSCSSCCFLALKPFSAFNILLVLIEFLVFLLSHGVDFVFSPSAHVAKNLLGIFGASGRSNFWDLSLHNLLPKLFESDVTADTRTLRFTNLHKRVRTCV
jgi:hypothetical protein